MRIRNLLVAVGAFFTVQLATGVASAHYVCGTSYRPSTTGTFGSEGYVQISVYDAKDCTGNSIATYWLCSTGATSSSCASSATYRYERQGLLAVYRALVDAVNNDTNVQIISTVCNGGAAGCVAYPHFWAY